MSLRIIDTREADGRTELEALRQVLHSVARYDYLKENWKDIEHNSAGHRGVGNSIGGILFEWVDEWWKAYEPGLHDSTRNWSGPFPDGWNYEEWLGVASQGDGKSSPYLRQLKKTYFLYQEIWKE